MTIDFSKLEPFELVHAIGLYLNHVARDCVMPLSRVVDPTDTGCYTVIWRCSKGGVWAPAVGMACGEVTTEKWVKHLTLAHEKAVRLAAHPDHIASFQSADESDPANPKYPGAVRMDIYEIIISTSGFGWKFDEMVGMQLGWLLRLVSRQRMLDLIRCSDNMDAQNYLTYVGMLNN